jgi:hypothetical protein
VARKNPKLKKKIGMDMKDFYVYSGSGGENGKTEAGYNCITYLLKKRPRPRSPSFTVKSDVKKTLAGLMSGRQGKHTCNLAGQKKTKTSYITHTYACAAAALFENILVQLVEKKLSRN